MLTPSSYLEKELKVEEITGVLLAGGKSRRMGIDKRRILLNGQTLVERVLAVLESMYSEVLVVVAEGDLQFEAHKSRVVTDIIPNCATAGGLFTGLSYAENEVVFVVACDMPFLHKGLITHMASRVENFDITVAELTHGIQPLHGFYRKNCLPALERMIKANDLKVQHLFNDPNLSTQLMGERELQDIDPHLLSFMNVNTPSDLEMARKVLQQR